MHGGCATISHEFFWATARRLAKLFLIGGLTRWIFFFKVSSTKEESECPGLF